MSEPIVDYDPASALETEEAIAVFLDDALETGDAVHIANAREVATRAWGMISAKNAAR
jgi:DNA-binding phage protein